MKIFLSYAMAFASALIVTINCSAHEDGAEDKSPIPETLGGTWQAILKKQVEIQGAAASQSLPAIHALAFRLRDMANTLPDKSRDVSADKATRIAGAIKNISKVADELDKAGDGKDQVGIDMNLKKLDALLKVLANQYEPSMLANSTKAAPPSEELVDSKEHAHSDHESKRGGVLMMKDDYHIEAVQAGEEFRVYFFNEFTRPIPVGKITGRLVLPLPEGAKPNDDEPTSSLLLSNDGMYLWSKRPAAYPDDFLTVRLLIEGQDSPFSFPIFKTSEASCPLCGTKTIAGLQAVSACGMCSGKLAPKENKIACTKCANPVLQTATNIPLPKSTPPPSVKVENGSNSIQILLTAYYDAQKALSSNDLQISTEKSKELAILAGNQSNASKQTYLESLSRNAKLMSESTDLVTARKAFGESSLALIAYLEQTGPVGVKYYVLHCPMAKVGNGDWVQSNPVTSNPYFGGEMLRCGSVKKEGK